MKLFTKIVTLLILMAVLAGTFSNVIIETAYYAQKAYIVKEKCENRYRPMAHCDGKCYLKKQLQQEEKKESQGLNFEKMELVWFQSPSTDLHLAPVTSAAAITDYYSPLLMPGHLRMVYHPPTV